MDVFDRFLIGDTGTIEWCFDNTHFIQRLKKYRISRDYIVDTVLYEEPLRYDTSGHNKYEVVFNAPSNKEYREIRLIFACHKNTIDLLTVIPEGKTQRLKNKYADDDYKQLEKKRNRAYAKRKKLY
ncbi:MAG: hypothetical protein BZ135_00930 [Methanosphaera sp. rholeuAM6]|nr:MAG: hypothetical protein BZ135_00930 [Methanosphaera sp. rholeuAM6]